MNAKENEPKWTTREEMIEYINGGRAAIEQSLLSHIMRSICFTDQAYEGELSELYTLLDLFNRKMARFEYPRIDPEAANDETGALS